MEQAELSAHLEIQQVLYRYCRGVDRGDAELISSVYHDDATDDHGTWKGPGKAFAAYLVPSMDGAPAPGQHHITNTLIEVSGEEAFVESYFIAFHPDAVDSRPRHSFVSGRYLDRFARREGAWRIADRKVVIDIARPLDEAPAWPALAAFARGARREADPSAGHFSRTR